jgi:hypothetical protein
VYCFPRIFLGTPSCWRIKMTGCERDINAVAVPLFSWLQLTELHLNDRTMTTSTACGIRQLKVQSAVNINFLNSIKLQLRVSIKVAGTSITSYSSKSHLARIFITSHFIDHINSLIWSSLPAAVLLSIPCWWMSCSCLTVVLWNFDVFLQTVQGSTIHVNVNLRICVQ